MKRLTTISGRAVLAAFLLVVVADGAMGQSLFRRPVAPSPESTPAGSPTAPGQTGFERPPAASPGMMSPGPSQPSTPGYAPAQPAAAPAAPVSAGLSRANASLILVEAPKPKRYSIHDKVSIIIAESSSQSSQQKLDAKKDASLKGAVNSFPDISMFLQGNLTNTGGEPIATADLTGSQKFKGDGKFERTDKFTDKIQATVIDVKPNGVLVLEARKTVGQDKEIRTLVLSGEARQEDVTDNNTVLSSQLSDLTILAHAEGDSKDAASKGFLTRLVETVFNF